MTIVRAARLTKEQLSGIEKIIEKSTQEEQIRGAIFLDNRLNAISDMNCFFLAYVNDVLCGILTLFTPDLREGEIYAYVAPEYRQKKIFTNLLQIAKKSLAARNITNVHFVVEPASFSGKSTAKSLDYDYDYSEYILSYNMNDTLPDISSLEVEIDDSTDEELVYVYEGDNLLGVSNVGFFNNYATIYNFEVTPDNHGKGLGKKVLYGVISYIIENEVDGIILNVNSRNASAYNLYTHHGFMVKEQLDYYRLPTDNNYLYI